MRITFNGPLRFKKLFLYDLFSAKEVSYLRLSVEDLMLHASDHRDRLGALSVYRLFDGRVDYPMKSHAWLRTPGRTIDPENAVLCGQEEFPGM